MKKKFSYHILLTGFGFIIIILAGFFMFLQFRKMISYHNNYSTDLYNKHTVQMNHEALENMAFYIEKHYPILQNPEILRSMDDMNLIWDLSEEWNEIATTFDFVYISFVEKNAENDNYVILLSSGIRRGEHPEWLGGPAWNEKPPAFIDEVWRTKQQKFTLGSSAWGTLISLAHPIMVNGNVIGILTINCDVFYINDIDQQEKLLQEQENATMRKISAVLLVSLFIILAIIGYMYRVNSTSVLISAKEQDADKRTKAMLDATPLYISLIDKNYKPFDCNQRTLELFELENKREYLDHFFDFSPLCQPNGKPSKEMAIEYIKKALKKGQCIFEWIHQKLNRESIPCEITLIRISYKDEDVVAAYMKDLREIKAKETALSEVNERTQLMFNAMPLCAGIWSKDFKIIDCNDETLRLFNLANKQEYIDRFFELSPEFQPDGKPSGETALKLVTKAYDEGYCRFDWRMQKLNGEPIPVNVALIRINYGDDFIVVAYFRDLREEKALISKTREADERTKIIFDTAPIGSLMFDDDFNIYDCNQEIVRMFETPDKRMFIDRFFELSPEYQPNGIKSSEMVHINISKTPKDGGYYIFEWMHQTLDKKPVPCEVTQTYVKFKDDFLLTAYVRDLRKEKEFQEKTQEAYDYTQLMLDSTPLSCILIDRNFNFIDCNKEALNLFAVSTKEDYINRFFDFSPQFQPDGISSRDKAANIFKKTFEDGFTRFDWLHINADGEFVPAEVTLVRVKYKDDFILAGYTRDLREIKAKEAETRRVEEQKTEAEAANRAKSNFLARVSHEIRTPMNAILGITEIQLQNEKITPDTQEAWNKIYNSGYLLLGIINDILDLSKIEAGKLELIPVQYDVASLINDTVQLNIARYDSKSIDFTLEVDENLPATMYGDELRIKQILNNLLSNAFKYTEEGEVALSITAEKTGDQNAKLIVRVKDTGQGMTKEQINKMFTEYTRFNEEANRTTEGTGLGMNITKQLVQMMKGEIRVESSQGKGSVFHLFILQEIVGNEVLGKESAENLKLYSISKSSKMKKAPQIIRDYMPYGRILVVDDVETNLYVARGLMAPYGLSIDTVSNGYAAIEKIKEGITFDIIFMDHFMPKMDGIETVENIRALGYKEPIIALTANALTGQAEMFMEKGFDGFISKPIDIRQLNAILNKLIRDKYPADVVESARRLKDNLKKDDVEKPPTSGDIQTAFIRDAEKAFAELDAINSHNFRRDDDIQTYVIFTHAMKGALANIGEIELSAVAFKLEEAGRNRNIALIREETPAFLKKLRLTINKIKQTDNGKKEDKDINEEDKAYLLEKLATIQEACALYDRKPAKTALDELKQKTMSNSARELLITIDEDLLHSNFEEVTDAAKKLYHLWIGP